MPFAALKRLTAETTAGRLLLELIAARVAVYSPHTAFDSAAEGINQRLAAGLGLRGVVPLTPAAEGQGAGRWGWLEEAIPLGQLAGRVKEFLKIEHLQMVGDPGRPVRTVAVACGAAGELLPAAVAAGCDAMVLGETRFHTCLEAEATGISLLLPGHFASERFAVERLAECFQSNFPTWRLGPAARSATRLCGPERRKISRKGQGARRRKGSGVDGWQADAHEAIQPSLFSSARSAFGENVWAAGFRSPPQGPVAAS